VDEFIEKLWQEYASQPVNWGPDSGAYLAAEHDAFVAGAQAMFENFHKLTGD